MDRPWLHFASRTSPEGAHWVETYQPYVPLESLMQKTIRISMSGGTAQAGTLLAQSKQQLEGITMPGLSISLVLYRWYFGALAYVHYREARFSAANVAMQQAAEAVAQALSAVPALLLMAIHCQEFCLHQARIAAARHEWTEMRNCIELAQAMAEDKEPLCRTSAGSAVYFAQYAEYFSALGHLSLEESQIAEQITNLKVRRLSLDRYVRSLLSSRMPCINYVPGASA